MINFTHCPSCKKGSHHVLLFIIAALFTWLQCHALSSPGDAPQPSTFHVPPVGTPPGTASNTLRRFIVHYKPGMKKKVLLHLAARQAKVVHHMHKHAWVAVHGSDDTADALRLVEGVTHVEMDHPRQLMDCCRGGTFRISDTLAIKAGKGETTSYGMWLTQAALKSGSSKAGRVSTLDSKVIICVIDTGVDVRHPDFKKNKFSGCSNKTACPFPWNKDVVGHGTFVAGLLAAEENGVGTVGVIPKGAQIHVVRIFDSISDATGPFSSNVVGALNECERHLQMMQKMKKSGYRMIINMSFGDINPTKAESDWFASRSRRGDMLFVAAAGNSGTGTVRYPAAYPGVISVAAVDCQGQWIHVSSVNRMVDIAAPGSSILSSAPLDTSWSSGTMFADDSTGVTHEVVLQSILNVPASGRVVLSGRVVVCPAVPQDLNATACPGVKGKVCLIQLSSRQDYESNLLRCQAGGAKAAVFYDDPAVCIPPVKKTLASSTPRITGGGTMVIKVSPLGDAAVQRQAEVLPAVGIDSADGAMMDSYIRLKRTFDIRLSIRAGGPYQVITGTSASTAFVAGIAARVWAAHPGCNATDITQAMYSTAMDTMTPGYDTYTGHGLVQAVPFKAKVATLKCA